MLVLRIFLKNKIRELWDMGVFFMIFIIIGIVGSIWAIRYLPFLRIDWEGKGLNCS